MTYRDDLDAAQARADALQHEVDKLERENEALRTPPRPAPSAPGKPRSRRKWWLPVAFVAGVVLLILGIAAVTNSCMKSRVTGTISAKGPKLGTWTVQPTWCRSGQHDEFRGVQFFEDGGNEHGVGFHQPVGEPSFIAVNMEHSDQAYRFTSHACRVLDGHIEQQASTDQDSTTAKRITNLRGHVKFDCTDGDEHVSGDLTFENCH